MNIFFLKIRKLFFPKSFLLKIIQYENDLKIYDKEIIKIRKSLVYNKEITEGVFQILQESDNNFEPFIESDEDKEEKILRKKYKDAIEWRGPLLGAIIGKMNGFEFRVYSNDHGKHFHIIHKGRGINARFSFPQIELINYKGNLGTINSREKDRISDFFRISENFQKLENEFKNRY